MVNYIPCSWRSRSFSWPPRGRQSDLSKRQSPCLSFAQTPSTAPQCPQAKVPGPLGERRPPALVCCLTHQSSCLLSHAGLTPVAPRHAILPLLPALAHPGPSACKALPFTFPAQPGPHIKRFPQVPRLSVESLPPSLVLPGSSGVDRGGFPGAVRRRRHQAQLGWTSHLSSQGKLAWMTSKYSHTHVLPPLWSQQKPSARCPRQPETEAPSCPAPHPSPSCPTYIATLPSWTQDSGLYF